MSDPYGGVYKKLVIKDDKLVGACLYGDTVDGSWYFRLLRDGRTITDIRDKLMFGHHSHQEVREAIVAQQLLRIDALYAAMNWRTPNGCASCRPAVNYYLLSSWPKQAEDDPQSR